MNETGVSDRIVWNNVDQCGSV